jgi:hypothetical protein
LIKLKKVLISKLLSENRNYISGYGDFIVGFYTPQATEFSLSYNNEKVYEHITKDNEFVYALYDSVVPLIHTQFMNKFKKEAPVYVVYGFIKDSFLRRFFGRKNNLLMKLKVYIIILVCTIK